jgi:glycosyltransferase involved in cell wall biosynthesis
VFVWDRLTDNEYFSLLSQCDYNFLPLTYATFNNALLEAQSLGIKSIIPNIDGVTDYASQEEGANLYYNKKDDLQNIIRNLKKEEPSDLLKEYSKKFLWTNIYKQLSVFYNGLFN